MAGGHRVQTADSCAWPGVAAASGTARPETTDGSYSEGPTVCGEATSSAAPLVGAPGADVSNFAVDVAVQEVVMMLPPWWMHCGIDWQRRWRDCRR